VLVSKDKNLFKPTYWDYRLQHQQLKPNLKYSHYLYIKYDATVHYTNMYCAMRVIKEVFALLLLSAEGTGLSDDSLQCQTLRLHADTLPSMTLDTVSSSETENMTAPLSISAKK
jgi:hypothetical protein